MIKNTVHSHRIATQLNPIRIVDMYLSLLQSNHLNLIWIDGVETHSKGKKERETERERKNTTSSFVSIYDYLIK